MQKVYASKDNKGFQNYKATFALLYAPVIKRSWIDGIFTGRKTYDNCPKLWVK